MDLTGHPVDIPLERPATPWGARILLGLVALLFMLVALACGGNGGGGTRAATATPPKVQAFNPVTGVAGETLVTITGTGFSKFTAVKFGTVAAPTAKGDGDTRITVQVPTGAATGAITVVTPLGAHTSTTHFTVTPRQALPPVVNTFQPAEGQVGTAVTLAGIGFAGAAQVSFGGIGTTDFSVQNGTTIQVNVPVGAKTGPVSVVSPAGIGTTDAQFTVLLQSPFHHLPPTVTAFSPEQGAPGTRVELTGDRMEVAIQVAFNGQAAARIEHEDDQHLAAYVPMGATSGRITVTTKGGTGSSDTDFTVVAAPADAIASFTPESGAPGDLVTLTGTGFAGAAEVTFGGVGAVPQEGVTDTSLTVRVPAGAVTGPLSVLAPKGLLTSTTDFTVINGGPAPTLPTLASASPTHGAPETLVTLTGTGLEDTKVVYFEKAPARFRVVDDSTVLAEVPAAATTGRIWVGTPIGAASWSTFTVDPPLPVPVVTDFNPKSGPSGTVVTITGTELAAVLGVTFGGATGYNVVENPDGTVTATVPADAHEGPVGVTTSGGTSFSSAHFDVTPPPPPDPNGFTPPEVVVGDTLTIDGTSLSSATAVAFTGAGGTQVIQDRFTTFGDTELSVKVPSEAWTGPVAVLYQGGQAALPGQLVVFPFRPLINGFSPARGIPGTMVALVGTNFGIVNEVSLGRVALGRNQWIASPDGKAIRVMIPDNLQPGDAGVIAVASAFGTSATDRGFSVLESRYSTVLRSMADNPDGLPVLDFPSVRRVEPYLLNLPQAPVFHPKYPAADLLPDNINQPSRPDVLFPSFTLNLLLPDVFYGTLPADLRTEVENRGFRNKLQIMVVSQNNAYNSDSNRPDYQGNRDDYEFKPQYWLYPDTPHQLDGFATDTAIVSAGLFSPVGDPSAAQAGLTLNGFAPGLMVDTPVEVALGLDTDDLNINSFFPTPDRLVLEGLNYQHSYAFWSLTLADTAVATLHLMLNDDNQRILSDALAAGNVNTLADLGNTLSTAGFTEFPSLASLFRPMVTSWHREALEPQGGGQDEITLRGDMFTNVVRVVVTNPDGSQALLDAGAYTVDSNAQMRLRVARGTVSLVIVTLSGTSDAVRLDVDNLNQ